MNSLNGRSEQAIRTIRRNKLLPRKSRRREPMIPPRTITTPAQRKIAVSFALFFIAITAVLVPSATSAPDGVEQRVEAILGKMSLEQKIDMIGGQDEFYIRAYPDLGVPRLRMADGSIGVRHGGPSTTMAGGISLASSWDPALAAEVGSQIARDARAKGVHFMLGPAFNIYRAPMNGRNFEYMGEDPYLAGQIAVGYIQGMQSQGVSATAKHFIGNNSDFDRHNTDSIIDERTMREIYLPAFEAAVKQGHVRSVMDSYNLTNGIHMTQNGYLNNDVLKKEWGFDGILMSDWTSTYDAVGAANGGLDLEMPSGKFLNREKLLPAIQQGSVSVATIDDKVRRILRVAIQFGWLDHEQTDLAISRYNREGDQVALQSAREGAVLLKNDGNLLPLKKDAVKAFSTTASGGTVGFKAEHFANPDLQGAPFFTRTEERVDFGPPPSKKNLPAEALSSRWTGYYTPGAAGKYDLFVSSTGEDGGYYRLFVDDKIVLDDWTRSKEVLGVATLTFDATPHKVVLEHRGQSEWLGGRLHMGIARVGSYVLPDAKKLAAKADVVVVAVGFDPQSETEGADRTFHLPPGQDELIQEMTAANKNTIVVLTSGGG